MAIDLVERYRRWFDHECDSNRKVLDALDRVEQERRGESFFRQSMDLFAHIVAARQMWLQRLGVDGARPPDLFPRGLEFENLQSLVADMEGAWSRYLARLDAQELEREFEYDSFEGGRFRNRVEDILTQLAGHVWHHRGQIAHLMRVGGYEPAVTDYVFWTRQAVPDSGLTGGENKSM